MRILVEDQINEGVAYSLSRWFTRAVHILFRRLTF